MRISPTPLPSLCWVGSLEKHCAEEKLRFFWADSDMIALRAAIRENLGLEWPEKELPTDPVPGQPEIPAVSTMEELRAELTRAISAAEQPLLLMYPPFRWRGTCPWP